MSHLQELYAKYRGKGLVVLGVNVVDAKEFVVELLQQKGVEFPNIVDTSPQAVEAMNEYEAFDRGTVPMTYLIDPEGKVVDAWHGYKEGHLRAVAAFMTKGGEWEDVLRQEELTSEARNLVELLQSAKRIGIVPDLSEVGQNRPPKVQIVPGSPAEKAGIRSGDRVTAINGRPVKRIEDAVPLLMQLDLAEGLPLSLVREGKPVEVKLPAELFQGMPQPSGRDGW
jgi:membrane-associated protease RseP (regulator of RpoE activity)